MNIRVRLTDSAGALIKELDASPEAVNAGILIYKGKHYLFQEQLLGLSSKMPRGTYLFVEHTAVEILD